MYFKSIIAGTLLFYWLIPAFGQKGITDSVFHINEVSVDAKRFESMGVGLTISRVDAGFIHAFSQSSLAEILSQGTNLTITNYGLGGLTTASVRGGTANSTPVVWNDINLQSPMNGQFNLSAIPVGLLDNIAVQNGGSGVMYGSGAMSGIIHLGNANLLAQPNNAWISPAMGSFGNRSLSGGLKLGNSLIASSTKIFTQAAVNDFSFVNYMLQGKPRINQTNAGVSQFGFLQENMLRTSAKSFFKASCWYQQYDKNLQTPMYKADTSHAWQNDNNLMLSGNWKYIDSSFSFIVKSAMVYNQVLYNDEANAHTNNHSTTIINEIENKIRIAQNHSLQFGLNNTNEKANSEKYAKGHERNRTSAFAFYRVNRIFQRVNIGLGMRNEYVNRFTPMVYSVGLEYACTADIGIKANWAKNYRIPTLNDLYWKADAYASGNSYLKPESGWSSDLGVCEKLDFTWLTINLTQNIFYNSYKSWIVWLPNANNKIWMPENKDQGIAYGAEFRVEAVKEMGLFKIKMNAAFFNTYSYITRQSGQVVKIPLPYVAQNKWIVNTESSWKRFTVFYTQNYTGMRYSTGTTLKPFDVADLGIQYKHKFWQTAMTMSFRINNLWDKFYEVREMYAMPMRNYQISILFDLFRKG